MGIITTTNTKLGGNIAQVNMPYIISCREDAPCKKECYCAKGNMNLGNVKAAHIKRYNMILKNIDNFFNQIDGELSFIPYKYFRWHSCGDIPNMDYLDHMCRLARQHRETRFLCFTKKYELINEYFIDHNKPSNLVIVLSHWKNWHPRNDHNFPESYVDFGDNEIPTFAYECSGNCGECPGTHCWYMNKGDKVIFKKH